MAPIRTAIIGLSSTAITSWASTAHLPYLLSPLGRQKFQIVALCNTSVEAAQRAISTYSLPPDTKAYGDPQALADDANIDLVVCCTRVDVHYSTILPSVKAGKGVFVEWPLAQDAARARELVGATSEAGGGRTLVGLQGRVAPVYVKIRKLLDEGRIGKVLSSEARAAGGSLDREFLPPGLKYFTDRSVGGNIITIGFAHSQIPPLNFHPTFYTMLMIYQCSIPYKMSSASSTPLPPTSSSNAQSPRSATLQPNKSSKPPHPTFQTSS